MSFNSTEWRNLLSNHSGSQVGTRSWSVLGNSQYQGEYYGTVTKVYSGTPDTYNMKVRIEGCKGTSSNPKTVESFYSVTGQRFTFQTYYAPQTSTFLYQTLTNTIFSTPFSAYTLGTLAIVADTSFITSFTSEQFFNQSGTVTAFNGNNSHNFYNYSPWGASPYSGGSPGSDVAIGRGPSGSPSSGYPYQRYYIFSGCP